MKRRRDGIVREQGEADYLYPVGRDHRGSQWIV